MTDKEKLDFVYSTLTEHVIADGIFSYHNPQYVDRMKTSLEYVSDLRGEIVNNV